MEKPNIDRLIPIMPACVREEFVATGAGIMGWTKLVEDWLINSTHPEVERFVNDVRKYTLMVYKEGLRRQVIMNGAAPEFYRNGNRQVRTTAVIDPVVKAYNKRCFQDPDAINDTKRKDPRIFIK